MTKTKAVRLARILFETSRTKGDYLLKNEKNLESYLKELNLDSNRILTEISSFANAEKQETSQSKTIIQESNTLQYAY
jgi:coenzyme F420-reducing hydrogenase delta subunit